MRGRAAVYLGFAGTGVALTQPGALMPVLLRRWSMGDGRGGVLLFGFYVATSLGALCSRGRMRWSVTRGAALTAVGAAWLSVAGSYMAFGAMVVFGLGLGMAMTSVSLMQSRLLPDERRLEMVRLNLVWAMGAVLGPWLALRAWRGGGSGGGWGGGVPAQAALSAVAIFFAIFAVWMACFGPDAEATEAAGPVAAEFVAKKQRVWSSPMRWAVWEVPWPLLLMVFCATGVEAAAGGWLTAYAQRAGDSLGMTIGAATCLWGGLLLGRLVHSTRWATRWSEVAVLRASTAGMAMALLLLVAWPVGAATMAAAAGLGFAIGPVYPLLLAVVLRHREQGGVFVIAGVGSSILPFATGEISGWTHSLRTGLLAPLLAAVAMSVIAARGRSAGGGAGTDSRSG